MTLNCNGKLIDLSSPKVMGILNVTPDSFYDGGKFKNDKSNTVDKISQDVLKLLETQNLNESQKGEVVLKVLRKIMNFSNKKNKELA